MSLKFHKIAQPLKSAFWVPKTLNLVTNESLRRNNLFGALTAKWSSQFTKNTDLCAKNSSYIVNEHVFTELCDEKLLAVIKYYTWFFYFDDQFDDIYDDQFCESQTELLLHIIKTGVNPEKGQFFAVDMFADVYKDIFNPNNDDVNNQFFIDVKSYLEGVKSMVALKNNNNEIHSDKYLQIRQSDIGLMSLLSVMYQIYPEFLSESVTSRINENEIIEKMKALCCKHAVLVNDILGFNKDINEDTGLNFIMLLHEEKQSQIAEPPPLEDTVNHTVDLCNNLFIQSRELEKELKATAFYHHYSRPIDRWIQIYHAFIAYHINWYYVAQRYTSC